MIITNLDHLEEVTQASEARGGWLGASISQLFAQFPITSSAVTSGVDYIGTGDSIGNTSIAINYVTPITIAYYAPTNQLSSSYTMGSSRTGNNRQSQGMQAISLFAALFGLDPLRRLF